MNTSVLKIGEYTYGKPKVHCITDRFHVEIGKFCSIAPGVNILLDMDHRIDWISTYPFSNLLEGFPDVEGHPTGKGNIIIGNDVWIGMNVIILSGVTIGNGAVIGTSSVVTQNVNDYEIVAGNPARFIKPRFSIKQILALNKIQWWNWPLNKIKQNVHLLQSNSVNEFIKQNG